MDTRQLDSLCSAFRRRLKALLMQAGICRLVLVALLLLPPFLVLDWWLHLPTPLRSLALLAYLAALGATGWWTLVEPLSRRWSNEEVLACLDAVRPDGQGMLLELYELTRAEGIQEMGSGQGQAMVRGAVEELGPLAEAAEAGAALERRRAWWWTKAAGVVLVACAGAAVPLGEHLSIGARRFFNPFSRQRWPHRTTITLQEPESGWTVPQMESLTVEATVSGVVPPQVVLAYRGRSTGYWIKEKIAVRDDGAFRYTFPEVREPMRFTVRGGDYTTDMQRIEIVERPYLKRIAAHYDYPDYAGIPDRVVESGQLVGLEGTRVRLVFESSMALKKALFILEGKAAEELSLASETTFEKPLVLSADGSYSVELYEKHGFREAKPERYEIRVTPDHPPEVELLAPGRNLVATPQASVDVAFRASDDFGLRKLEFLYQIDDGEPTSLSDRITGPLEPKGKTQDARFTWDLRKMELPKTGILAYFVRVQDVNPTGRGTAETAKLQIRLVKPSEFHFETFERAKRLEAEARVAWESQFAAWELGKQWPQQGTGKEDDALWQETRQKQDLAIRAAKAMEAYLRDLTEQYEQNDMAREFMAGRLGVVAELLRHVTETEHPAIAEGLAQATPRTDADAAPDRLRQLRAGALAKVADNQKLAVLRLERLVKRLFDWRDLQTTLIRTTLLHEEQGEALELTEEIAPKTLGWEVEDLPDDVQDKLLTLGKRQRTLYDVESELEKELEFQLYRAEMQQRQSILDPLRAAFRGLRENRVNDNLKLAAREIENNQPFQIVNNQKAALHVLNIVKGGLIQAGHKVDREEAITLAMVPSKVIEVQPKPKPEEGKEPEPEEAGVAAEVPAISPEELLANLPLGTDPVTMAINVAWEAQDAVLARTRYLAANSAPEEMPRYVALKRGILMEKQDDALKTASLAKQEAEKAKVETVLQMLHNVHSAFLGSLKLLEDRDFGPATQQLQADGMETLDDLRRRFIPLEKSVQEAAEENRRRGGLDAFNRSYLLRDKDLEQAVGILQDLNRALLLERRVAREVGRFARFPAKRPVFASLEKTERTTAVAEQKQVAALPGQAGQRLRSMSTEAAVRVAATGVGQWVELKLAPFADEIAGAKRDEAVRASLQETVGSLAETLRNLKDLLGERVRPEAVAKAPEAEKQEITLEEWQKMRSPAALLERLKADTRLPEKVREVMLRALGKGFPPKYKELLAAYYASFLGEGKKE